MKTIISSARIQRCQRWIKKYHIRPLFLLIVTVVYLILGGAAFLLFEQSHHQRVSDEWYHQMRVERREYARYIARRIFNDTTQLLIVIDQDQTSRVTERLYTALKLYERKRLRHASPYAVDWSLPNSIGYSLGLLTTVGQAGRTPATFGGQVFALCYSLLGIPFFFGTVAMIATDIFLPLFAGGAAPVRTSRLALTKFLKISLATIAFVAWFLAVSAVLYFFSSPYEDKPWYAAYTVGMALLTVQIADWQLMETWALLALHVSVALSLLFFALIMLLFANWTRRRLLHAVRLNVVKDACTSTLEAQKFSVTIDKNGSSKLLPSASAETAKLLPRSSAETAKLLPQSSSEAAAAHQSVQLIDRNDL